jgi:hypothetical protein
VKDQHPEQVIAGTDELAHVVPVELATARSVARNLVHAVWGGVLIAIAGFAQDPLPVKRMQVNGSASDTGSG